MRTIIAGTRSITDFYLVAGAIEDSGWSNDITEVISGGADGVDTQGEKWAHHNNIPVKKFEANWGAHGKSAGPIRNQQMAAYASENSDGALIAVWDGISPGTKNMLKIAESTGLYVYVHRLGLGEHLPEIDYGQVHDFQERMRLRRDWAARYNRQTFLSLIGAK